MDNFTTPIELNDEYILNLINAQKHLLDSNIENDISLEVITISSIINKYLENIKCCNCKNFVSRKHGIEKYPQNCLTYINKKCN
jgi:hypothetical protein